MIKPAEPRQAVAFAQLRGSERRPGTKRIHLCLAGPLNLGVTAWQPLTPHPTYPRWTSTSTLIDNYPPALTIPP